VDMNRGIFGRRRKPVLGATRIMFLALLSLPSLALQDTREATGVHVSFTESRTCEEIHFLWVAK
jgi:hypothetical protein